MKNISFMSIQVGIQSLHLSYLTLLVSLSEKLTFKSATQAKPDKVFFAFLKQSKRGSRVPDLTPREKRRKKNFFFPSEPSDSTFLLIALKCITAVCHLNERLSFVTFLKEPVMPSRPEDEENYQVKCRRYVWQPIE